MDRKRIVCRATAVIAPVAALALRWGLTPWSSPHGSFGLFIIAVTVAAWCGGLGTGLGSLGLAALLCHLVFPADDFLLPLFLLSCLPICGFAALAHRARGRLLIEDERLREAGRERERMVALLAHELRNPLSSMSNALHLMRLTQKCDTRSLVIAERATQQMGRLVDDLMDMNRLARGRVQLRYHPFDLRELLLTVTPAMQESATARGLELVVEAPEPVLVFADAVRLSQVLGNLIGNAVKFTDQGTVKVCLFKKEKNACIVVEDSGVGILPEALPNLWEPFRQGQCGGSRGGLGLGLSVVKGLVEVHGGSVSVSSEVGKGTTFVVELPLEEGIRRAT